MATIGNLEMLDAERKDKEKRILRKLSGDQDFKDRCDLAARHLRGGKNFFEVRQILGIKSEKTWDEIKYVAIRKCYSPETAAFELIFRMKGQIELAASNYNIASATGDPDKMGRALMVMSTLEQRQFEVLRELGMLKAPVEVDGGSGFNSNDVIDVNNKLREEIEQRLLNQVRASQELQGPKPLQLLARNESFGEPDKLDEITLVKRNSR